MKPLDQSYSKSRRFKNQVKAVVTNPYNVIVLVAIVLLTYLIVLPLVDMLSTTFQLAQRDLRATGGTMADVGKFTLYYWQRLLASDLSWNLLFKPLLNSLTIGVGVSVCAIALGSILAWLMVRSDLPFKPFFSLAVIIPYMIPSWVKSQAWLSMFKTPRVGGAPGFIAALMMNAGISTEQIEAILSPIAYGRLAIIIVLFVFTSMTGYCYQAEANIRYLTHNSKLAVNICRAVFLAASFFGAIVNADAIWSMGDIGYGLMAWANIIAIALLAPKASAMLEDYEQQKKEGKNPVFDPKKFGIEDETGAWKRK